MSGSRVSRRAAQAAAREAEQSRARRRLLRRRLPFVALVIVVVVAGALIVGLRGDDAASGPGGASDRTDRTVLVQVIPSVGGAAVSNALTGISPDAGSATFAAIPSRLISEIPGTGRTTFDESTVVADGAVAAQALADQLGVIVDSSWVLTEPSFATLIDKVGGVQVDVDVDVTATTNGSQVIVVPKGDAQRLDGATAVSYATFLGGTEAEPSRLARWTAVWTQVLTNLPASEGAITALVTGDAGSVTTLSPEELASYLLASRRAAVSDSMSFPTLPTVVVDTGGTATSYRLDAKKLGAFIDSAFAGSRPPTPVGGAVSVLVKNGVGTPGLSEQARTLLVGQGLTYKGGGNAERFGYAQSVVLINDASAESRRKGSKVAATLGLPDTAVRQAEQGQSVADVLVILGADFRD